jgi:hypothetical protein
MADVQEEMGEEPEQMAAGGIAALRSGLPNEYAGGGIIAFANGTDDKGVHTTEEEPAVVLADHPEDLLRTYNPSGTSHKGEKGMVANHYSNLTEGLNAAKSNHAKNYDGLKVGDSIDKYVGVDVPKEKRDAYKQQFLKLTGYSPDTVINAKDSTMMDNITKAHSVLEQGVRFDDKSLKAVSEGKPYVIKGTRDGKIYQPNDSAPAKEAPKGIASLVQPQAASPLDLSELENLKSTPEDRDINAQMAKAEKLYGTNPDYERRAKSYDEQETKLKGDDDKAMWKALMHAGIGMMSGKSPNFMSNLASGVTAGAEDYEKTREDIDAKKAHLAQLRDALGDARRQERLAVAKYGADSVQASKASDKALALEGAKLKASRGEHELSAEVQGQANAVRATEVPSTNAMHEAAAVAQLANAAESAYKSSPEGRKKEELRGVSADIHDANAVITSSNATEEDKAHARLRLSTLESRLFELTGVKPTPPATTSITPESKGYFPTLNEVQTKLMDMYASKPK